MNEKDINEIEESLFVELYRLSQASTFFTEIMEKLMALLIQGFKQKDTVNTRLISKCFNILIHTNLHDLFREKKENNQCELSIRYQFKLFYEFMLENFSNFPNFKTIFQEESKEAELLIKHKFFNKRLLDNENCIMLLNKLNTVLKILKDKDK